MKLVLDSNVLIAAFASEGLCHSLLEYCLENASVFLTETLCQEVRKGLEKKVRLPSFLIDEIISLLKEQMEYVPPSPSLFSPGECRDPKDLFLLNLAAAQKCEYLVTGDHDLLVLHEVRSVKIVSPREFWNRIKR